MAQVHQAKVRITCDLEIPHFQKNKGIEIEFRANDEPLGELHIMGAHVYFRGPRQRRSTEWSFSEFVKLLEENRK
jgi:hypothetical protein